MMRAAKREENSGHWGAISFDAFVVLMEMEEIWKRDQRGDEQARGGCPSQAPQPTRLEDERSKNDRGYHRDGTQMDHENCATAKDAQDQCPSAMRRKEIGEGRENQRSQR